MLNTPVAAGASVCVRCPPWWPPWRGQRPPSAPGAPSPPWPSVAGRSWPTRADRPFGIAHFVREKKSRILETFLSLRTIRLFINLFNWEDESEVVIPAKNAIQQCMWTVDTTPPYTPVKTTRSEDKIFSGQNIVFQTCAITTVYTVYRRRITKDNAAKSRRSSRGTKKEEHTKWTAALLSIFCSGLFVFNCCRGTACLHMSLIL